MGNSNSNNNKENHSILTDKGYSTLTDKGYPALVDDCMKALTTSLRNKTKLGPSIAAKLRDMHRQNLDMAIKALNFKEQNLHYYDNFLPRRERITVRSFYTFESFWYEELVIFDVIENDCIYILYSNNEYYDISKDYIEHSKINKEKVRMTRYTNGENPYFFFVIVVKNLEGVKPLIAPLSVEN